MTDRFVVHVQLNGGYLPFDSQVIEGFNEAVEYILSAHRGRLDDDLQAQGDGYWVWELGPFQHATIERYNEAEHSELI
jgi:hypothetical protein